MKLLVIDVSADRDKHKEQTVILENTITGKNKLIKENKALLEKQAVRLDELRGELKVLQDKHLGHVNRLKQQHEKDMNERHNSLVVEIESLRS